MKKNLLMSTDNANYYYNINIDINIIIGIIVY